MRRHTMMMTFPEGEVEVTISFDRGSWILEWGHEVEAYASISAAAKAIFVARKGYADRASYERAVDRVVPGVSWGIFRLTPGDVSWLAPDLVDPRSAADQILEAGRIDPGTIDVTPGLIEHFSADHAGIIPPRVLRRIAGQRTGVVRDLMVETLRIVRASSWRQIAEEPLIGNRSPLAYLASYADLGSIQLPASIATRHSDEDFADRVNGS